MADLESALQHLLNAKRISAPSQSYKKDNPAEYAKVKAYLDGGVRPSGVLTEMGMGLVEVEDVRREGTPPPPPPPPPPTDAYFVSDWSTGKIGWEPWATIFQMGTPSTIDVGLYGGQPRASSDDGRVKVIPNPYGPGNVLQCEIRNSDPPSGTNTFQKAEVGSYKTLFPWQQGMEMWVVMDLYLPDDFGLASGGTNGFTNIADLHPSSNSGVPALGLGGYSTTNLQLYAGIPGSLQRKNYIPLDAAHRNRKLELLIGAKLATSGGWCEAWLDGQNVIPRFSAPMAEASESGPYWKQGLYKEKSASFPNGGSRILFGRTLISETRPF